MPPATTLDPGRARLRKNLWAADREADRAALRRVVDFFAIGMLMNVAAAMDLPSVDERWTSWCPKDSPE